LALQVPQFDTHLLGKAGLREQAGAVLVELQVGFGPSLCGQTTFEALRSIVYERIKKAGQLSPTVHLPDSNLSGHGTWTQVSYGNTRAVVAEYWPRQRFLAGQKGNK